MVDGQRTQARSASKGNRGPVGFPSIPAWFSPPRLMKSVDAEEGWCHCPMPESASVCRPSARCRLPLARVGRGVRRAQRREPICPRRVGPTRAPGSRFHFAACPRWTRVSSSAEKGPACPSRGRVREGVGLWPRLSLVVFVLLLVPQVLRRLQAKVVEARRMGQSEASCMPRGP